MGLVHSLRDDLKTYFCALCLGIFPLLFLFLRRNPISLCGGRTSISWEDYEKFLILCICEVMSVSCNLRDDFYEACVLSRLVAN